MESGFRKEDREENIRRVAEVAKLMNDAGVCIDFFLRLRQTDKSKRSLEKILLLRSMSVHH